MLLGVAGLVGCAHKAEKVYLPVVPESAPATAGIRKDCVTAMANDPKHPLRDLGNGWWYGPLYVKGNCIEYFQPK